MSEVRIEVNQGAMWDATNPWVLGLNTLVSNAGGGESCSHCTMIVAPAEGEEGETTWRCPRVIISAHDGGYGSSGICFDCAVEAVKQHDG